MVFFAMTLNYLIHLVFLVGAANLKSSEGPSNKRPILHSSQRTLSETPTLSQKTLSIEAFFCGALQHYQATSLLPTALPACPIL